MKKIIFAAVVGSAMAFGAACQKSSTQQEPVFQEEGTGGAGFEQDTNAYPQEEPLRNDTDMQLEQPVEPVEPGTGGAGEEGQIQNETLQPAPTDQSGTMYQDEMMKEPMPQDDAMGGSGMEMETGTDTMNETEPQLKGNEVQAPVGDTEVEPNPEQ